MVGIKGTILTSHLAYPVLLKKFTKRAEFNNYALSFLKSLISHYYFHSAIHLSNATCVVLPYSLRQTALSTILAVVTTAY